MKKIFTLIILSALVSVSMAQNLQFHFDPRHALHKNVEPRNYLTTTFEIFKLDSWGSTFMFVDFDFNQKKGDIGTAYMELARDIKICSLPVMLHAEFNGGVGRVIDNESGFSIPNAYLAGLSYATRAGKFNLSTSLSYKYNAFERVSHDLQWTGVWSANFANDKLTFSGFVDIWSENEHRDQLGFKEGKKVVFLTEPQLWFNASSKLAFGTEIEISNNFYPYYENKLYVIPTIGAKWSF